MQRPQSPTHILITAGHAATTALATIQKLQDNPAHSWKISWVGPRQAFSGIGTKPFELDLFPKLGVHIYPIDAGKLQSKFTRNTIPAFLKIPIGFIQAMSLMLKLKPDVVLSFGGFAAFPVVVAAWLCRRPIVLHEQTVAVGLSNKLSSLFATKITLARKESEVFFDKKKTIVIGNPLMQQVAQVRRINTLPETPIIYITGGSRGAQRINTVVFQSLPELLKKYQLIHQTGQLDFEKAQSIKKSLSVSLQKRYEVHAFINPVEIGAIYEKISILIGRAGANTVSEIIALSIPSILIPIPWSRMDEQTKNALFAQKIGIATLLPETELTPESLIQKVDMVVKQWKKMAISGKKENQIDKNASQSLVDVLMGVIS